MCLLIIISDVTIRECTKRLLTSECANFKIKKIKRLFIIIKVQLIIISNVIPYISKTNSTSSSLKTKPLRKKEERKTRWKRGEEEKREGKSLCVRKRGRERIKERKKGE